MYRSGQELDNLKTSIENVLSLTSQHGILQSCYIGIIDDAHTLGPHSNWTNPSLVLLLTEGDILDLLSDLDKEIDYVSVAVYT